MNIPCTKSKLTFASPSPIPQYLKYTVCKELETTQKQAHIFRQHKQIQGKRLMIRFSIPVPGTCYQTLFSSCFSKQSNLVREHTVRCATVMKPLRLGGGWTSSWLLVQFVGCWLNTLVYVRDGSAQTILCAATMR